MADIEITADVKAMMQAADNAAIRTAIGLGSADTVTFGTLTVTTANVTTANVTTFRVLDAVDQSHGLQFVVASNLTANRTLTLTTGDANRALTVFADTIIPVFAQQITFAGPTAARTITLPDAAFTAARTDAAQTFTGTQTITQIDMGNTDTSITRSAAGVIAVEGVDVLNASTAQTISGKTYSGAQTLAESAYILLDSVLSADGTFTGIAIPGTAGATLAFGDAVYLDPTDSRWELTDANAAAGADGDCRGLVGVCILAAASDGDPTRILVHGTVRADAAFPSFTVGAAVYFSETAGDLTSTAPVTTDSVSRVIGWAVDANSVLVSPSGFWTTHT